MTEKALNGGLTINQISRMSFRYSREGSAHGVGPIMLTVDGQITGHRHRNEAAWKILDGHLTFLASDGSVSTIFDQCANLDGKITFRGKYLLRPEKKIIHLLEQTDFSWENRPRHHALTRRHLAPEIKRYSWIVGDHTYGRPTVLEKSMARLTIGKFCSIAANVTIILGNHRTDGVSTYPFATMKKFWPGMSSVEFNDHISKGDVTIGSDVWIGCGVVITSGITIGHGAVIAANSVVTKDVTPYSIVGGNPAKLIKRRFGETSIDQLMEIRWWDWSDEKLNQNLEILMTDMDKFLQIHSPV